MRTLLAACALAIIAAVAVFGGRGFEQAQAGHEESVTPPVPVVNRSWTLTDRGQIKKAGRNKDGFENGIPAVVGNLATLGRGTGRTAIPVCSEAAYKKATEDAIAVWNAAVNEPIFRYAGTESVGISLSGDEVSATTANCPSYGSHPGGHAAGLRSILVRKTRFYDDCDASTTDPKDPTAACYEPEHIRGTAEQGEYLGRGEVRLNNHGTGKALVTTIAHEIGHALGFAHPYEGRLVVGTVNVWAVEDCPGALKYSRVLGRVRADRANAPANIPGISTPMQKVLDAITEKDHGGSLMLPTGACKGDKKNSDSKWTYTKDVKLSAYDARAFSKVYGPEAVKEPKFTTADRKGYLRLGWKSAHVHVEKGFEVQVKVHYPAPVDKTDWLTIATASADTRWAQFKQPADTESYTLVTTSTSRATYRVLSVTDAFGKRAPQASAISAEVEQKAVMYRLWVTDGSKGEAKPLGETFHAKGTPVKITATADPGYMVSRWYVDCMEKHLSEDRTVCSLVMDGAKRVHVTFKVKTDETVRCWDGTEKATLADCPARPNYRLTVQATGGGSGGSGGLYPARTTATRTATWNAATHTFEGWSGCTSTSGAGGRTCSVYMTGPKTVKATFKAKAVTPPQPTTKTCPAYTFRVAAEGGGSVSGGGRFGGQVVARTAACPTVTGSATAIWNRSTHTFEGWKGACTHGKSTCSPTLTRDESATAMFKKKPVTPPQPTTKTCPAYTFTVSASGGGFVSGGGTYGGQVVASTATCPTATGTATASWNKTSYTFRGWSGACRHGSATCSTPMTSSKSATARFAKRYCYVTAQAGSGGRVTGGGNVHCGVGSATIRAYAGTGYCFSGWGGGLGGQQAETSSTCRPSASITMRKPATPLTVIANFKKKPVVYYRLTVVGGAGGGSYKANTWATASASAGRCFLGKTYTFKRWSGDSSSTSRVIRLYMNRNKSVTATYSVGGACLRAEGSADEGGVTLDDGGGPAWTEAPATEAADP